jgi:hypothetical protein
VSLQDGATDLFSLINIDETNREILTEMLEDYKHEGPDPLTAVVELESENKENVTSDDYSGTIQVFEIQDNKELRTFFGIFVFTAAFGILLLLFLKRPEKTDSRSRRTGAINSNLFYTLTLIKSGYYPHHSDRRMDLRPGVAPGCNRFQPQDPPWCAVHPFLCRNVGALFLLWHAGPAHPVSW